MSKHSFAPKLSEYEAYVLADVSGNYEKYPLSDTVDGLWRRGLVERKKDPALNGTNSGWFKITRRGTLMRQRYQKQQADAKWRDGETQ